ncbi:hypothetical protein ACWFRF_15535 [Nocardia sp. NPDC055165]
MVEQARKLCLLGATDEELADFFDVNVDTIYTWKNRHKIFSEAIKSGKASADADVADRLHQRATGFSWIENQPIKVKEVLYDNGKRISEKEHVEVVSVQKTVPPDSTAAIFWMKNRRKENWRDRQEIKHEGGVGLFTAAGLDITVVDGQNPINIEPEATDGSTTTR